MIKMDPAIQCVAPPVTTHLVQWENHFHTLVYVLKNFTANSVLTDITFLLGKEKLAIHQTVLSCFTSYFNEFINNDSLKYFILLEDLNTSVLQGIIDYMYTGAASVSMNDVINLYRSAELFKLDGFLQFQSRSEKNMTHFTWPKHSEMLLECLWRSRHDPSQCDVIFITNNYFKLYTHSSILGACSKYLLDIFLKHCENKRKPYVFVLQNVRSQDLEVVLEYCYKGVVHVINENLKSVYNTADLLGIQSLCQKLLSIDPTVDETLQSYSQQIPEYLSIIRASQKQPERSMQVKSVLSNLLELEKLVDVSIFVDKRIFRAHGVILSAFSIYFQNLAKYLENSIKDIFIMVKDFRTHHIQAFLDYIYRGEAVFEGSTEDFCETMLEWLDFSVLPISTECVTNVAPSSNKIEVPDEGQRELSQDGVDLKETADITESTPDPRFQNLNIHEQEKEISLGNYLDSRKLEQSWEENDSGTADGCAEDEEEGDEHEEKVLLIEDDEVEEQMALSRKARRKPQETVQICQTCNTKFETRQQFKEHLAIHPGARTMKCKYCGKGFDKPSQMKLHLRTHTGSRPFQCRKCGMNFAAKSALTKHEDTHAEEKAKTFVCDVCNKCFSRKEYLEEHIRTHTGSKPFECNICQKSFVGRTGLNHHKKTHAPLEEKKSAVCEVCGKSFTRHALWTHMKSHDKTHRCELCHKLFATKTALKIHVAGTHLGHRRHQCEKCGKGFMQKNHLIRHMKVHQSGSDPDGGSPFVCDKCPRTFKTELKFESHVRNEHTEPGDRPYSCNICHKRFAGRSTVIYHRRAHTGERPHRCSTCGKTFVRPDALRQHIRSHTGERLFECSLCRKKCATRSTLNKHLLSHDRLEKNLNQGSNNFSCNICNKTFNSETHLSAHSRIHTGSRPFRCDTCRKSFRYPESLTKHLRVHSSTIMLQTTTTNDLPCIYSFQVCRQAFQETVEINTQIKPVENSYVNENLVHREDLTPSNIHHFSISSPVINDSVCGANEEKSTIDISLLPRRPYSITMDGNLCSNNVLPQDNSLVTTMTIVPPPPQELDAQELHSVITTSSSHVLHQQVPETHIEMTPVSVAISSDGQTAGLLSTTANTDYPSILSKAFSL